MTDQITDFRGRYGFLSNFYPCTVDWEQITYPSSEHAFNAGKSVDMGVRMWIAEAPTPKEAKRRGRSVTLRPGWDERVRYEVMAEVLAAKFRDRELAAALRATGDAVLIEGNMWHDSHWGICLCGRPACQVSAKKSNWLGRMLMALRESLSEANSARSS
jgi:ribA/ribD-fused uncharacterized protein